MRLRPLTIGTHETSLPHAMDQCSGQELLVGQAGLRVAGREEVLDRVCEVVRILTPRPGAGFEIEHNHILIVAQNDEAALRAVLFRLLRDYGRIVHQRRLRIGRYVIDDLLCSALRCDKCPFSPIAVPQRVPFFQKNKNNTTFSDKQKKKDL